MTRRAWTALNLLLLALFFLVSAAVYPSLPARIPLHFALDGRPDWWVARSWLAWFALPLLGVGCVLLVEGAGWASQRQPQLWNVPEQRRFLELTPEARAPLVARLRGFLTRIQAALLLLLMVLQAAIYQVASGRLSRLPAYVLGAVAAAIAVMVVGSLRWNAVIAREIRAAHQRQAGVRAGS